MIRETQAGNHSLTEKPTSASKSMVTKRIGEKTKRGQSAGTRREVVRPTSFTRHQERGQLDCP